MSSMPIVRLENFQQFAAINVLSDPGAIGGPVVVPSCAQIIIRWNLNNGGTGRNILYGRYAGPFAGSPAQATSIADALTVGPQWTALAPFLSSTFSLQGVTIKDVNTANQAEIDSTGGGASGTGLLAPFPDEVALVVTMRTALSGHQNRGRFFMPGWAADAQGSEAHAVGAAMTALTNWAEITLRNALINNGYTPVIGQKARAAYIGETGTSHPARPAGSVPITQFIVRDNKWDSQRRRGQI